MRTGRLAVLDGIHRLPAGELLHRGPKCTKYGPRTDTTALITSGLWFNGLRANTMALLTSRPSRLLCVPALLITSGLRCCVCAPGTLSALLRLVGERELPMFDGRRAPCLPPFLPPFRRLSTALPPPFHCRFH